MSTALFGARSTALKVVQGSRRGHYLEGCGIGVPQPASNRVSGFSPHKANPEAAQRHGSVALALLAQAGSLLPHLTPSHPNSPNHHRSPTHEPTLFP